MNKFFISLFLVTVVSSCDISLDDDPQSEEIYELSCTSIPYDEVVVQSQVYGGPVTDPLLFLKESTTYSNEDVALLRSEVVSNPETDYSMRPAVSNNPRGGSWFTNFLYGYAEVFEPPLDQHLFIANSMLGISSRYKASKASGTIRSTSNSDEYEKILRLNVGPTDRISRMTITASGLLSNERLYLAMPLPENDNEFILISEGNAGGGPETMNFHWYLSFQSASPIYLVRSILRTEYHIQTGAESGGDSFVSAKAPDLETKYELVKYSLSNTDASYVSCGTIDKQRPFRFVSSSDDLVSDLDFSAYLVDGQYAIGVSSFGGLDWKYYLVETRMNSWAKFWFFNELGTYINRGWLSDSPCDHEMSDVQIDFGTEDCPLIRSLVLPKSPVSTPVWNASFDESESSFYRHNSTTISGLNLYSQSSQMPDESFEPIKKMSPYDWWYLLDYRSRPFHKMACDGGINKIHSIYNIGENCGYGFPITFK